MCKFVLQFQWQCVWMCCKCRFCDNGNDSVETFVIVFFFEVRGKNALFPCVAISRDATSAGTSLGQLVHFIYEVSSPEMYYP